VQKIYFVGVAVFDKKRFKGNDIRTDEESQKLESQYLKSPEWRVPGVNKKLQQNLREITLV
jgi:hypothetical protein